MNESKFTGGLAGLIGTTLLVAVMCVCSLGLLWPWGVCIWQKWVADHTVIDGRQTCFDGTGGSLFGSYVKWWLLSIVTFGIYSFWLGIKMKQWVTEHTHLR